MNIKILDSWLREYLKTQATTKQIAEALSLTSVSVERLEPYGKDYVYDIEVTTNRPDLISIVGLAREASAVLPQFGHRAQFVAPKLKKPLIKGDNELLPIIKIDHKLVSRICAIVMDVDMKDSPQIVKKRLETTDIRPLNNLIDITNYVMREIGHPTHVFDYDRLGKTMIIRESKKGEKLVTLDHKEYILPGGDIVADNGKGEIIDLLGIMGTLNSVVTDQTKRIVFFIDDNNPNKIRKTSMSLGIRTEAAVLNEKGIDPELSMDALLRGIELYQELANGRIVSTILDIYNQPSKPKPIVVMESKIDNVIGVKIPLVTAADILLRLGCEVKKLGDKLEVTPPSSRADDIKLDVDVIEEIARVYGYYKLPSILPPAASVQSAYKYTNNFYWEQRAKEALKYWGLTETYTYSFVSSNLYEGPPEEAVVVQNPLSEEFVYMRKTLVPSLLEVVKNNKSFDEVKIFEIANVYHKQSGKLPQEVSTLAGVIKKKDVSFFEVKGLIEALLTDLGIKDLKFKPLKKGGLGTDVYTGKSLLGEIEALDDHLVNFELNFQEIITHATIRKVYNPLPKYPPVIEDVSVVTADDVKTQDIIDEILKQSKLISSVTLIDQYTNSRTFHIMYQDSQKNLTTDEVEPIRFKIQSALKDKFDAKIK